MRIVIVEDEAPIRNGMGNILTKINSQYELVGKACNGEEGLKLIEQAKPDLVILDIEMPYMDGLTMLTKLRKRGVLCKAIVLTAYSDFDYAKRAIELDIENYILKPIKIPELKRALQQVEKTMQQEQKGKEVYTLEYIFRNLLTSRPLEDEIWQRAIQEQYGMSLDMSAVLFAVYMGNQYEVRHEQTKTLLGEILSAKREYKGILLDMEEYRMFVAVLYQAKEWEAVKRHFARSVIPTLYDVLECDPVCIWNICEEIGNMKGKMPELTRELEWNLLFDDGTLLEKEKIEAIQTEPMKYPLELETQVRQAISRRDEEGFEQCFRKFCEFCKERPHNPKDVKEACIRYCYAVLNTAKEYDSLQEELSVQKMFQVITEAVTWEAIHRVLLQFSRQVTLTSEPGIPSAVSAMVKRAQGMIREYYNQGITLEEIAEKLNVSDEYLSTQFKKETGTSFTETIRRFRIDKIKKLLVESSLKLNQIADMAGYADPKYMSKVFKEEVGMLPAEYRKMNK